MGSSSSVCLRAIASELRRRTRRCAQPEVRVPVSGCPRRILRSDSVDDAPKQGVRGAKRASDGLHILGEPACADDFPPRGKVRRTSTTATAKSREKKQRFSRCASNDEAQLRARADEHGGEATARRRRSSSAAAVVRWTTTSFELLRAPNDISVRSLFLERGCTEGDFNLPVHRVIGRHG